MKKLIFLFLLAVSLGANAQKVEVNRVEKNGSLQIMISGKDVLLEKTAYSIHLKAFVKDKIPTYCLLISSFNEIPNDAKVLFRLENGHVIYLDISSLNVTEINSTIKKKRKIIPKTQQYYSSIFTISESDLDMIGDNGIVKMRISEGSSYLEKTWKNDRVGKFLAKSKRIIQKNIEKKVAKDIWDNF